MPIDYSTRKICTITISRDVKFDKTSVINNSMKTYDGPSEKELRIKLNGQAFDNNALKQFLRMIFELRLLSKQMTNE